MDISIDGIIGSAKKINNQRNTDSGKNDKKTSLTSKTDTIEISSKVDSRLNLIQQDLKTVQASLAKQQVIQNGLNLMGKDLDNQEKINNLYNEITFNNEKVLMDFLENKESVSIEYFQQRRNLNESLIKEDLNKLAKLQIETENFLASNLITDKKVESALKELEASFADFNQNSVNDISNLNADVVSRLIQ